LDEAFGTVSGLAARSCEGLLAATFLKTILTNRHCENQEMKEVKNKTKRRKEESKGRKEEGCDEVGLFVFSCCEKIGVNTTEPREHLSQSRKTTVALQKSKEHLLKRFPCSLL